MQPCNCPSILPSRKANHVSFLRHATLLSANSPCAWNIEKLSYLKQCTNSKPISALQILKNQFLSSWNRGQLIANLDLNTKVNHFLETDTEERLIKYLLSTRNSKKAFRKPVLTAVTEERHIWNLLSERISRKALGKPVLAAERQIHVSAITHATLQLS